MDELLCERVNAYVLFLDIPVSQPLLLECLFLHSNPQCMNYAYIIGSFSGSSWLTHETCMPLPLEVQLAPLLLPRGEALHLSLRFF